MLLLCNVGCFLWWRIELSSFHQRPVRNHLCNYSLVFPVVYILWNMEFIMYCFVMLWLYYIISSLGDPLHSRAPCTQPCNVNTHSRAHCNPGARLCEQWGHGCVNNGARLCASARLCRGSPVFIVDSPNSFTHVLWGCFIGTRAIMGLPQCQWSNPQGYIHDELVYPWTKWTPFRRQHFQMHFLEWKFLNFDSNFTEVPKCPIDNKWALVQIMSRCQTGDKPLSEPMLTQFTYANMRHKGGWVEIVWWQITTHNKA